MSWFISVRTTNQIRASSLNDVKEKKCIVDNRIFLRSSGHIVRINFQFFFMYETLSISFTPSFRLARWTICCCYFSLDICVEAFASWCIAKNKEHTCGNFVMKQHTFKSTSWLCSCFIVILMSCQNLTCIIRCCVQLFLLCQCTFCCAYNVRN